MFVETKTKLGQTPTYRDWQYICKHGNTINNARGGATVFLKPKLRLGKANPPSLNNPLNDCLHFTVPYLNDKIHIFLAYIHPHSPLEQNILTKACLYKYAIIIGDLNLNKTKKIQLKQFLDNSDFMKQDTPPTFLMPDNEDSTPDVLIHTKNLRNNIRNINLTNELGSDHLTITFQLDLEQTLPIPNKNHGTPKLDLTKTDTDKVKRQVHNYIQTQTQPISIESLQQELSSAIESFTPRKKKLFTDTLYLTLF